MEAGDGVLETAVRVDTTIGKGVNVARKIEYEKNNLLIMINN